MVCLSCGYWRSEACGRGFFLVAGYGNFFPVVLVQMLFLVECTSSSGSCQLIEPSSCFVL